MPDIASEIFGEMRYLTPEENARKRNMYRKMSEPEYIEREAVIRDLSESIVISCRTEDVPKINRVFAKVIDRIKAAPTADVAEVKRGEWVKEFYHPYWCSCCKEIAPLDACGESHYKSNFCPNCGAKMDGKERKR